MTTVDQFLKALAMVESSDNPEAWGDAGRAMGRWQVHPDALWTWAKILGIAPVLGETWDQLVARMLRKLFNGCSPSYSAVAIAMRWHLGHWADPTDHGWDAKYASRFAAALAAVEAG